MFMNKKLTILGRRFYLSSLRDVAVLESVQSRFYVFHTFRVQIKPSRSPWKNLQTSVWKKTNKQK